MITMFKRWLCLLLSLVMLFALGGCNVSASNEATDPSEETAPTPENKKDIEPPEVTVPDITEKEPLQTIPPAAPEETNPPVESIPEKHESVSTSATTPPPSPPEPKPTEPKPTEPATPENTPPAPPVSTLTETTPPEKPTEAPTEPPTEPEPIPEVTEPAGCQHDWQTVYHPEESHYGEAYVTCACGYRCQSEEEWATHAKNYSGEELVLKHGGWGSSREYIVDSPEYYEWICSKCGEVRNTQP